MATILIDQHCEGHAVLLGYAIERLGLAELVSVTFLAFEDVALPETASDEIVWQFCQDNGYLLLTGNRRTVDGDISLELVTQRLANDHCMPILTIGSLDRLRTDSLYCDRCAATVVDVVWGIEQLQQYLGTPRLYIPFNH